MSQEIEIADAIRNVRGTLRATDDQTVQIAQRLVAKAYCALVDIETRVRGLTRADRATAELAACDHPMDQQQELRTIDGTPVLRCSDCGTVCYRESDGSWTDWTRPVLVAHVCGAVHHAGEGEP
jgi:hypothetical protein